MGELGVRFVPDTSPVLTLKCNRKGCAKEWAIGNFASAGRVMHLHIKDNPECGKKNLAPQFTFISTRKIEITSWNGNYRTSGGLPMGGG